MLVLSRKEQTAIQIGDDITVKVERITGSYVKLSIDAPREVEVWRGEIWRAKQRGDDDRTDL